MSSATTVRQTARVTALARELTARDGVAILVGSVIGSGIFLVPGEIARNLHSFSCVLMIWVGGGLLTLAGALSLAELGAMFPHAGGLYIYLREAYGNLVGFLYGWVLLTIIQTGSIATLASGFALYVAHIVPMSAGKQQLLGVEAIALFTALNLMSLHRAKQVQNIGTAAKIVGMVSVAVLLLAHAAWHSHTAQPDVAPPITALGLGAAITAVLWAYEGWHVVSFTAGEFRDTKRDLPRSLLIGTILVAAVYLLLNTAYYAVLSPQQMAGAASPATEAVGTTYGQRVVLFVSIVIAVSILGAVNGMILTGPRVYFAMARDGLLFRSLAHTTRRSHVPAVALLAQGIWASFLTLTGHFRELFSLVIFTAWIFYGLSVGAVLVLRKKRPHADRPFRVPVMPWIPAFFVLASAGIVIGAFASSWKHALMGLGFLLLGVPVFLFFRNADGPQTSN